MPDDIEPAGSHPPRRLLALLERRLDNVVFRLGFTPTIPAARQAVARAPQVKLPTYLAIDPDDRFSGRMSGSPLRGDVPFIVTESAIVEFYAR